MDTKRVPTHAVIKVWAILAWSMAILAVTFLAAGSAFAHCDSLGGPVVKAAQQALDTRNLDLVLIWVKSDDEPEIRVAFERTLTVRGLSDQAKWLADQYFFETVVRVHRAGEGAPYTGLKPASRDLDPAISAADQAIDEGLLTPVVKLLTTSLEDGLRAHFEEAVTTKKFKPGDVNAGRKYVKAYVEFIHYVERLYQAITISSHGQFVESNAAERH
jgi:hypothetical protein